MLQHSNLNMVEAVLKLPTSLESIQEAVNQLMRWLNKVHSREEENRCKYDNTSFWELVMTSNDPHLQMFQPLAMLYYQLAPIQPAEGVVEGFFSIAGFLFDSRRHNLSNESLKTVCLTYLWKELEGVEERSVRTKANMGEY